VVEAAREVVGEELLGSAELTVALVGWGNNRRRLPPVRCSWRKTMTGESRYPASLAGAMGRFLVQEGREWCEGEAKWVAASSVTSGAGIGWGTHMGQQRPKATGDELLFVR
jgi:hypothetical protein